MLKVTPVGDGCRFAVRVQPRASRTEIVGVQEDVLRVRLTAPPVDGQANAALVQLLAERLGVRRADISIMAGQTGRNKQVEVAGVSPAEVVKRLGVE